MTRKVPPGTLLLRTTGACDFAPGRLLEVFGEQRRRFVAVLRQFGPDDWAAPTRCAEWSAHDVVRHLCDVTPAIAAGIGDRMFDMTAGFDPRVTTRGWLTASAGESPPDTLRRLVAGTEELLALARDRLARGHRFDVGLPYGPMDWTVLTLHIFWDSWIHERDVLLARGAEHPTGGDATGYATAYGLFLAAAVASMLGDPVSQRLTLGGDGGGSFDLDGRGGAVTLTVTRVTTTGPPAAQVADALAGRAPAAAVLGGLPTGTRAAMTRLGDFFNTPVRPGQA
ncbi:maleylpyruvate isomerase family mycothiol-dependent enzyme [Actinomadura scrupuli]|uniref:maleylpyruvate isomerase family mycothiol-dependent enzyme n=1 Tax=Actinomadura scrupuli TaxID=559629 RepID=UPI003D955986